MWNRVNHKMKGYLRSPATSKSRGLKLMTPWQNTTNKPKAIRSIQLSNKPTPIATSSAASSACSPVKSPRMPRKTPKRPRRHWLALSAQALLASKRVSQEARAKKNWPRWPKLRLMTPVQMARNGKGTTLKSHLMVMREKLWETWLMRTRCSSKVFAQVLVSRMRRSILCRYSWSWPSLNRIKAFKIRLYRRRMRKSTSYSRKY